MQENIERYDAIIIGGGPSGSTCAHSLCQRGMRVLVLDRAAFPRVKLCAGWISTPIWDVLELSPRSYPRGLWEWHTCHVWFRGRQHAIPAHGYFIRRYEFDEFLLRRSGADVRENHAVKRIEEGSGEWLVDGKFSAPYLIGAAGTHCPVARQVFPAKADRPVGVQEREFPCSPALVADHRIGADGEPELLLHDDLRGYSWNISKTDWLNVGCGTLDARAVRDAWQEARTHFESQGHIPREALAELERMHGHSYYLYNESHVESCERRGALLVGDSLGLAQPLTAEGILPAVLSGKLCAEAIAMKDPGHYRRSLQAHPILNDYRLVRRARDAGAKLRGPAARIGAALQPLKRANLLGRPKNGAPLPGAGKSGGREPGAGPLNAMAGRAVATAFAWMFSGKPLPAAIHRMAGSR